MPDPFAPDMGETGLLVHLAPDFAPVWVQVMGERASGTNMIRKLITMNTALRRTEGLGWKHGFPAMVAIPADLLVVVAVRHAEDWALSMHRRPWHLAPERQRAGFSEFLRAPWDSVVDRPADFETLHAEILPGAQDRPLQLDRHPVTGAPFPNLFALRSAKLRALAGLVARGASVVFVQMERARADPEGLLGALATATGTDRTGPLRVPERAMGHAFSRACAVPTPDTMSEADRAFMRGALDLELEAAFGYRYD